jgi:hypothetical protein
VFEGADVFKSLLFSSFVEDVDRDTVRDTLPSKRERHSLESICFKGEVLRVRGEELFEGRSKLTLRLGVSNAIQERGARPQLVIVQVRNPQIERRVVGLKVYRANC